MEMERFRFAVENLLNRVNPYTGMKWKDDPAVAVVETYNESFLGMQRLDRVRKTHPQEFAIYLKAWQDWYAARHDGRRPASEELPGGKSPEAGEYMLFQFELIKNTVDRCTRILREAGYRGIITQNSSHRMFSTAAAWECLAAVDNHGYFCHPSKWSQPGSVVRQDSAAGLGAMIFRRAAGERLPDRPMLIGEYNHAYWNRYQYELPLTFDAYAALQDFSVLCIHEYPVMLKFDRFLSSFYIVNNPVLRAGEFLAHMLFQRGDVRPSPHLVTVAIPDRYWMTRGRGLRALGTEQTKAALLTGFGVEFPQLKSCSTVSLKPDLRLAPGGTAGIFTHSNYSDVIEAKDDGKNLLRLEQELRRRGVLAPDNRTDVAREVFESDTGELLMRTSEKMVQAVTPRTEAVALPAGQQARLGRLEVLKVTTPGCVALTSVSGEPLDRAKRLVLIYSTCAANSGMRLSSDRSTMIRRGETPVLLETGQLELEIRTADPELFELYALRLDGSRSEKLPLAVRDGKLAVRIDTAKLAAGPTVFFELVKKK